MVTTLVRKSRMYINSQSTSKTMRMYAILNKRNNCESAATGFEQNQQCVGNIASDWCMYIIKAWLASQTTPCHINYMCLT